MSSNKTTLENLTQGAEVGQAVRLVPFRSWIIGLAPVVRIAAVAVVLFAAVVSLQSFTGAFTAEFSGYPDEASHYMSGLLVHDYAVAGLPAGPMRFAQNFYLHYPYLAIGHWPPFFYAIEGGWMLLFSSARVSVMLLMALITTLLALAIYKLARPDFGTVSAWIVSLLLICNPLVLQYTSMVMLETLLALLSLGAVVYFGRFADSGRWQDSAKFAAFASLAILTKANGFELALVPPLCLLACRRISLAVRPSFWVPAAAAGALCLPWHFATMHLILPTFTADAGVRFTTQAAGFYTWNVVKTLGPGLLVLAVLGLVDRILKPLLARRVEGRWAALAALPFSVIAFHSVVSAGFERRYLVTAVAPLLLLCAAGARSASERFRAVRWGQQIALLAALLVFAIMSFTVPAKASFGFKEAANRIVSDPNFQNSLILVSSETNVGEGIFVSEMAMRDHGFHHVILRASKVLAENAWNQSLDDKYRPLFADSQALTQCLQEIPLRAVIIDSSQGPKKYQHHQELLQVMESHQENWTLLGSFNRDSEPHRSRGVDVYSFTRNRNRSEQGQDPLRQIRTNLIGGGQSWPISMRLSCHADVQETRSGAEK